MIPFSLSFPSILCDGIEINESRHNGALLVKKRFEELSGFELTNASLKFGDFVKMTELDYDIVYSYNKLFSDDTYNDLLEKVCRSHRVSIFAGFFVDKARSNMSYYNGLLSDHGFKLYKEFPLSTTGKCSHNIYVWTRSNISNPVPAHNVVQGAPLNTKPDLFLNGTIHQTAGDLFDRSAGWSTVCNTSSTISKSVDVVCHRGQNENGHITSIGIKFQQIASKTHQNASNFNQIKSISAASHPNTNKYEPKMSDHQAANKSDKAGPIGMVPHQNASVLNRQHNKANSVPDESRQMLNGALDQIERILSIKYSKEDRVALAELYKALQSPWFDTDVVHQGCGDGKITLVLSILFPKKSFVAYDSDESLVKIAKERLDRFKTPLPIVYVTMDEGFVPYFSCNILVVSKTRDWKDLIKRIAVNPPHIIASNCQNRGIYDNMMPYFSKNVLAGQFRWVEAVFTYPTASIIGNNLIESNRAYRIFAEYVQLVLNLTGTHATLTISGLIYHSTPLIGSSNQSTWSLESETPKVVKGSFITISDIQSTTQTP